MSFHVNLGEGMQNYSGCSGLILALFKSLEGVAVSILGYTIITRSVNLGTYLSQASEIHRLNIGVETSQTDATV